MSVTCHVPDSGAFEFPEDVRSAIKSVSPTEVHLRVSRQTEGWKQKGRSLVRMIMLTTHEAGS